MDGLWSTFNKSLSKKARSHRSKFLPDDEFTCAVLARVARQSVENPDTGLPVGAVVTVIQVSPPQVSNNFVWKRINRPYLTAVVLMGDVEQTCNLESLEPV